MRKIKLALICYTVLLALIHPVEAVVTFSVTPSAVSNTYNGIITLQISGLTNGESVVVQKFLDLNTNGIIDGSDLLVQQFNMTDGQAGMVIGGVTNFNVPGDSDSTANGQITATLNFQGGDFVQNIVGNFLYKLSSPVGHFTPITKEFTVTNFPFPQKITGVVFSNNIAATVPNAIVVLCQPSDGGGGPGPALAGVVANNAGNFTIQLPAGMYVPVVASSNYVFNFSASPAYTLAGSQSITSNLTLTKVTSSISGQVVDATNSGIGLPAVWLYALTSSGDLAFTFADTNGGFNMAVTPENLSLIAGQAALIIHGYVGWNNGTNFTAGASPTTLAFPKATALLYGNVKDSLGNPLPGVSVESDDNNGLYDTEPRTDANGNYVIGILGGLTNDPWEVQPNNDSNATNYIYSEQTVNGYINAGQAVLQNFTGIPATNQIIGSLKDNTGNPIFGVGIWANAAINGVYYHVDSVRTDTNGNYSLNVGNGTWDIGGFLSLPGAYLRPADQYPVISNNNAMVNFTAMLGSNYITGSVRDNNGHPIANVEVIAQSGVGSVQGNTDANGNYSMKVANGTWTVGVVDDISLPGSYLGLAEQTVVVFNNSAVVNLNAILATNQITGLVKDNSGNAISGVYVSANAAVDGVYGSVHTDANGNYTLYVANSTWTVGLDFLPTNYISPASEILTISNNNAVANFTATLINSLGSAARLANGQFQFLYTGTAGQNYTVQMSTNLSSTNWTTLFTTNSATTNAFIVVDPNVTNKQRFYRVLVGP